MPNTSCHDETLARYADDAAALMGLSVDPTWREAVLSYLKGMQAAARLVEEFELPDELDPAPTFSA